MASCPVSDVELENAAILGWVVEMFQVGFLRTVFEP